MSFSSTLPIVSICLALAGCSRTGPENTHAAGPPIVAVRAVQSIEADVPLEIASIGNVEAISTVDVKARVTSPVTRVAFREGQDVQQGMLLFELDQEPYLRQIAEIEANLARDAANVKEAQANIAKDQATLKNAQSIADRGTKLAQEGIFSREQTDQVVSAAESAKASLQADQAALESAQAATKADAARLAQTKLQLSYTKIYAPISGRAGAIPVKEGNVAKENETVLVTLLQITPVYVSFSIPENLLTDVRKRLVEHPIAVVAVPADGAESTGKLSFVDSSVDATTGTIKLKAIFENSGRHLWPGQFVNVRAQLNVERGRILIPAKAVQTGPNGKFVWIIDANGSASMRFVQVLRNHSNAAGEQAVVGSGLKAGESVVSEGQLRLMPGAHVRLLDADSRQAGKS